MAASRGTQVVQTWRPVRWKYPASVWKNVGDGEPGSLTRTLSLNISREMLQQDRQIQRMNRGITGKVLSELESLKDKESEKYLQFWNDFGRVLKEGLFQDRENQERLLGLALFRSTADGDKLTSLREYVDRMPASQNAIYYMTGESSAKIENSPHLEAFKAKNIEVLIAISDKKAQFWIDNTVIQTRLIDGLYPETSRLIPTEFMYELTLDARDILNAIDRASFIKSEGVSIIKLSASGKEILISSKSQEVGSSLEKLNAIHYKGNPLEISFSGRYVFDAVRVLNGTVVKIEFSGEMKPFIIRNAEDDSVLQLILPVRTYS